MVHEDSAAADYLVLPPSPELTEAELEAVAGGSMGSWSNAPGEPA